jgi:hypothetical protein
MEEHSKVARWTNHPAFITLLAPLLYVASFFVLYNPNGLSYDPRLGSYRQGHFRGFLSPWVRIPGDLSIYGKGHGQLDRIYYPLMWLMDRF